MANLQERYGRALRVYQETSREAWESVLPMLASVDAQIVRVIVARGGATSAEVERATGLRHQTVSAQIRHMSTAGLLEDVGERRANITGRKCVVWHLARHE